MNVVGVISEYNPFHQGHQFHLEESRRITEADYCITVMSGDYVQRGTPAVLSKHKRAEMALLNGADLVLELPVSYAAGSAEYFAGGAVSILQKLGVVTHLSFGSEYGDLQPFPALAKILDEEPAHYQDTLKAALKDGISFPAARAMALSGYLTENPQVCPIEEDALPDFLSSPNNLLGLEYCKALRRQGSKIQPVTISRRGKGYHETALEKYASATAIRKELTEGPDWIVLSVVLPKTIYKILQEEYQKTLPICEDDFSLLLKYKLMQESAQSLCDYQDVTSDLACRIKNRENEFQSFSQFSQLLKTKELTHTRICRALLHILLGIHAPQPIAYARVLGMKKEASPLLSQIKEKSRIPLLTKLADSPALLSEEGRQALELDVFASNLYESVLCHKFQKDFVHEYQKPLVIL
ncbi:MAG: nucleotidyltransferase [Blautia sp.]|jgi:predicted nucleotidyltransferase